MKNTISDILNRECYGIQKIIYSNNVEKINELVI